MEAEEQMKMERKREKQKDRNTGRGRDGNIKETYERRETVKWKSCKEMEKDRRREEKVER